MIGMGMAVELPSDDVSISVHYGIESNSPIIKVAFRRDMTNQVHLLPYFLGLTQFAFNPFEHVSWVRGILQKQPILIISCLSVHGKHFHIV